MALVNPTTLAFPPLNVPMVEVQSGKLTQQWSLWFQQMYVRIGGQTPVNPQIKTQPLMTGYPFNFFLVPSGQTVNWNGTKFTQNQIVPYYQSGISVTTLIDSFMVTNTSPTPGTLTVYLVPNNNLPTSSNLLISNLPIPANMSNINIPDLAGVEMGSGAYLAVVATPNQKLLCTLTGRLIT